MFEEQPRIISSSPAPAASRFPETPQKNPKKIIFLAGLGIALLVVVAVIVVIIKNRSIETAPNSQLTSPNQTTTQPTLPGLDEPGDSQASSTVATSSLSNLAIERLSFADFYQAPTDQLAVKINDYQVPLNIKIDVMNYYDVSRKLLLDPGLDNLNNQGLAILDNPWPEAADFYAVYNRLSEQQVPLLITSDFIVYYYQSVLKKAFKDIEENIFYENLWSINKELYTLAKDRYEARLAAIGNVNDSILEGERLAAAYFAVSLELLKPASNQIAAQGSLDDKTKFTSFDADRFYFVIPPYLRADVLREVELIRAAKDKVKSPVLLYTRDYKNFSVATDYQANAKLNNFYLTTKWLNSVFPLEPRRTNCPNCLLDQEDSRINLIAASLITTDFYNAPELKAKWARIYKIMAFFKGLREELNYLHYHDSLAALFGEGYKLEELFADTNSEANSNLEKLRQALLAYNFPEIQGAWNKQSAVSRPNLGLKILADSYWPNNYLFDNLVSPAVGAFLGASPQSNNITACEVKNTTQRCSGLALDVVNLVQPINGSAYFSENTNYANYAPAVSRLQKQLADNQVWRTTNYWTTLSLLQAFLGVDKEAQPRFASSPLWQEQAWQTAVSTWVNFQLPLESLTVRQDFQGSGLNGATQWSDNFYIDPNLKLINELLASNEMLLKMLSALRLNEELGSVSQSLQDLGNNLTSLKEIITKELTSVSLSSDDNEAIVRFAKQFTAKPTAGKDRQLNLAGGARSGPKEELNQLKLLVLIHKEGDNLVIAIGPVWHYLESR